MMNSKWVRMTLVAVAFAMTVGTVVAEGIEFDLKDPKGVHNISFILDSEVEPIMGLAAGITGKVTFDPTDAGKMTGKVVIAADSLHIENKGMEKTLHGPDWIDVKAHPTIEFAFKSVKDVKKVGENRYEMSVTGDFTCRGVTQEITTPVTATFLKDGLQKRQSKSEGDLLVLRSQFSIKRTDFGIKPDMGDTVVANEIQLRIAIVGTHAK